MKKTTQRRVYNSEVIRAKCFGTTTLEHNHLKRLSDLADLSEQPKMTNKKINNHLMEYHKKRSTTACFDTNAI